MFRLSFLSCRLFFFTYAQILVSGSVRGIAFSPAALASAGLGCIGFMNAAFGLRVVFFAAGFLAAGFFAGIFSFSSWRGHSSGEISGSLTERDRGSKALF